ncbi:MAG TPA: hypothetical protein VK395_29135 [Gemmataceae bacterium]|nr:hypothetical protein [Gemmataceae bacterium]
MYNYIHRHLIYRIGVVLSAVLCLSFATPGAAHADGAEIGCLASYCPNQKYVNGVYMCGNFAQDYQANCTTAGITSWTLSLGNCTAPQCNGLDGHALNIVLINNPNNVNTEYCVVEPQNGNNWCWYQSGGPPVVPSWIMPLLYQAMGQNYLTCYNACNVTGASYKLLQTIKAAAQ